MPIDPPAVGFAGAAQLARIERHIWVGRATTPRIEVVFVLTSLGVEVASAARLLAIVREHWGTIENGHHHRRDRTYREDQSPVRDPNASPCLSALRCLAIFLCAQHKAVRRRPQDFHLPDFHRWAGFHLDVVIGWISRRYTPP